MTRKTAEQRHVVDADAPAGMIDVLVALHHPTRRWLAELLWTEGPASVGRLAARTGLAVGSVSHHLRPLHRQGFIEPAPELARDTRESWWRATSRSVSWSVDDFEPDSLGRRVAEQAEVENFRHQVRAVQQWLREMSAAPLPWRRAAGATDSMAMATADQTADLHRRLGAVLAAWGEEVKTDQERHPDAERRPVRTVIRCFPSRPVRP
ncbi:helix-turn-helix domain-containing protein [Nocardioides panacisoli]|uniref:Helix-turn-helix domain-containing protein n=1 Tax=Nocardioides panacisoli TaxID=627624 RepID=A0ABP7IVY8_9ACTN